ncbi:uncharacterized protein LOC110271880 [Arachis ipaensis]|uniref:uncharacterized protein LOC110271880 n=1 Tax=Arachis ipaensis TaxID=130454 RepID=UPI000A2B63D8|nr:uncharacterized protein LOC110271880 [Arachis ipaensis]
MFTSDEWVRNKLSREAKGREATKIVIRPSFWNHVKYTLKIMGPLVRVLRLVDAEKKPPMGYIYEAMEKAKECIMKTFSNDVSKYSKVFKIVDNRWNCQLHRPLHAAGHFLNPDLFYDNHRIELDLEVTKGWFECITRLVPSIAVQEKILEEQTLYKAGYGLFGSSFAKSQRKKISPAFWWRTYGHEAPNMRDLTIKILSLTCSASGCERNWSIFEHIHTKKRNRLDHERMESLVFIKYNQQLIERYNLKDEVDPIALNDIDECNEWLVGEIGTATFRDDDNMDDDADLIHQDDNTLSWNLVFEAMGGHEPMTYTRRQQNRKRKEPATARGGAKGGPSGSKASKKGKGKAVIVEEEEEPQFEDEEDSENEEEQEEEIQFNDTDSEDDEGRQKVDDEKQFRQQQPRKRGEGGTEAQRGKASTHQEAQLQEERQDASSGAHQAFGAVMADDDDTLHSCRKCSSSTHRRRAARRERPSTQHRRRRGARRDSRAHDSENPARGVATAASVRWR